MIYVQEEAYRMAVENYKTQWHRTRRGGKSMGLANLAVFYAIILFGYRANKGKVVWRAPYSDQLQQAQEWLKQNPFVMRISSENDVYILDSPTCDMGSLTSGKVASKGASVFIMDEYKKVNKGHKMYADAKEAYGMLAEGDNAQKRMISASTGQRLTEFHDQYLSGEWEYSLIPWKLCPWITEDFIESERKGNLQDPWYILQEYDCVWVNRGGAAFNNIYIVNMEEKTIINGADRWKFGDHPFFPLNWTFPQPRKAGVDFNESSGHYLVVGSVDDEAIYVNFERVLGTIAELKAYGHIYRMEIESGPFKMNMLCAQECRQLDIPCYEAVWTDILIAQRFKILRSKMIIVDYLTAQATLTNLEEAVFDENARESKLKKRPDQHGLDALMHMIHNYSLQGQFFVPSKAEKAYIRRKKISRTTRNLY